MHVIFRFNMISFLIFSDFESFCDSRHHLFRIVLKAGVRRDWASRREWSDNVYQIWGIFIAPNKNEYVLVNTIWRIDYGMNCTIIQLIAWYSQLDSDFLINQRFLKLKVEIVFWLFDPSFFQYFSVNLNSELFLNVKPYDFQEIMDLEELSEMDLNMTDQGNVPWVNGLVSYRTSIEYFSVDADHADQR